MTRSVLVTGGIGRAIACGLAVEGWQVIAIGHAAVLSEPDIDDRLLDLRDSAAVAKNSPPKVLPT